jgi:hypothetical protein
MRLLISSNVDTN